VRRAVSGVGAALLLFAALLTGCGGGGGGGSTPPPPVATPTVAPTPTPTPSASPNPQVTTVAVPESGTFSATFPSAAAGYGGSIVANGITTDSAITTIQAIVTTGPPPVLSLAFASTAAEAVVPYTGSNGSTPTVLEYLELTPSTDIDLSASGTVTLTFTFPAGTLSPSVPYFYAFWLGQLQYPAWIDKLYVTTSVPATETITITGVPGSVVPAFRAGFIYGFAIYHN